MTRLLLSIVLQTFLFNIFNAQVSSEIATIEKSLTKSVLVKGEPAQNFSIEQWMDSLSVPNISIAVVKDGEIYWTKGYGLANPETGKKVDANTLFQAASISKPVAALGVHKLVELGKVDLDVNVNDYLVSWKLAENRFTEKEKVTLRRLMTHSAGTTVHGFPGYRVQDTFPSDEEVLSGDGNTGIVEVDTTPGSINRYSGGGYTIMERVVEDVSESQFNKFMHSNILAPMNMGKSSYEQPLPEGKAFKASVAFNREGGVYPGNWHSYPEQAAAGLWTTPTDLGNFMIGIQEAFAGNSQVITKHTAEIFLTRDPLGHGHGPAIMDEERKIFGHGGKNAGYSCAMIGSASEGWGVAIMSGADNAHPLISAIERSISTFYGWDFSNADTIEIKPMDESSLEKLAGTYHFKPRDLKVKAYIQDGKLLLDTPFQQGIDLDPLGDYMFIDLDDNTRIEFKLDSQGNVETMVQDGRHVLDRLKE